MKVSICLSTFNKPEYLKRVLNSIDKQSPPFEYEVIVVDDGSPDIQTEAYCLQHDKIRYYRINREPDYRNPAIARNYAYERAYGDILILQSDDVEHTGEAISGLVRLLDKGRFVISTVYNVDFDTGKPVHCHGNWYQLTGPVIDRRDSPNPRRPLFFLGSAYKKDVYDIGGCDEDFTDPGREDIWFADCLMNGLKLKPYYTKEIIAHHLHHKRPSDLPTRAHRSMVLYRRKVLEAKKTGIWKSGKGIKNS